MPSIIICPGIHPPELTESFLEGLLEQSSGKLSHLHQSKSILIFPAHNAPAYSAFHVLQFLWDATGEQPSNGDRSDRYAREPLVFMSFSAGVVGAIGAAGMWQLMGGSVEALIALDGWGVPLYGNFPIHRLSHDRFTHWSSALLGSGEDSFYADPPVEHLELWRHPQRVQGWWIGLNSGKTEQRLRITAAQFLTMLLERYLD